MEEVCVCVAGLIKTPHYYALIVYLYAFTAERGRGCLN